MGFRQSLSEFILFIISSFLCYCSGLKIGLLLKSKTFEPILYYTELILMKSKL